MKYKVILLLPGVMLLLQSAATKQTIPTDWVYLLNKLQSIFSGCIPKGIKTFEENQCVLKNSLHPFLQHINNTINAVMDSRVLEVMRKLNNMASSKDGTGRHRRHRNNMMMMMMFGATALGMIIVPLGFQLLAALSGKALLLAKMALLLASVNGLKKIAASGVHYGLYHVPDHSPYGYFDRGDVYQPRISQ